MHCKYGKCWKKQTATCKVTVWFFRCVFFCKAPQGTPYFCQLQPLIKPMPWPSAVVGGFFAAADYIWYYRRCPGNSPTPIHDRLSLFQRNKQTHDSAQQSQPGYHPEQCTEKSRLIRLFFTIHNLIFHCLRTAFITSSDKKTSGRVLSEVWSCHW